MRKTYRVNADRFDKLIDILITPEDFNEDLSRYYDARNGVDRYRGTLRGRKMGAGFPIPDSNWLSGETRAAFFKDWNAGKVEYIVWSYNTPIAWRTYEGDFSVPVMGSNGRRVGWSDYKWTMPKDTYTRTTSKHQGKVAAALSQINGGI